MSQQPFLEMYLLNYCNVQAVLDGIAEIRQWMTETTQPPFIKGDGEATLDCGVKVTQKVHK